MADADPPPAQPTDITALMSAARTGMRSDNPVAAWEALMNVLARAPAHVEAQKLAAAFVRRWRHRMVTALRQSSYRDAMTAALVLRMTGEHLQDALATAAVCAPELLAGDRLLAVLAQLMADADAASPLWDAIAHTLGQHEPELTALDVAFEALVLQPGRPDLVRSLEMLISRVK